MASKARSGRGWQYAIGAQVDSASAGTPTPVEEVSDMDFQPPEWGTDDSTNLDSLSDAEFLSTVRDGGMLTLTMNRISGAPGQVALKAAAASGELYAHTITAPKTPQQKNEGDVFTFNALVLGIGQTRVSPKSKVQSVIKLKISGGVTETPGS